MLTLSVGREIILYFNNKQHKATIIQIEFGEIVWVKFEDEIKKEEYYHMDELKNLIDPNNIGQIIEGLEEQLYN